MTNAIVEAEVISTAQLIQEGIAKGIDLVALKEILKLREIDDAFKARKAFHQAMAEFKSIPLTITKDKQNKQYNSMYTTLGNLVNTVNPELSKFGLSSSWEIHQNGTISVTCKITHKFGHTEQCTASAPADTSGAKNPIQQIKSTITYLKSVTFESITGLASTDANVDDDGNGHADKITEKQLSSLLDLLAAKELSEKKLLEYLKIEKLEDLPADQYMKAVGAINAAVKVAK